MEYPNPNHNPPLYLHHHPIPIAQPPFHVYPPQPHFHQNPTLYPKPSPNPNPSFVYHHRSSIHTVVSAPPTVGPPAPVEPVYPGGPYPSQATTLGGDYNSGNVGLPSYYHDPNWNANARFDAYSASVNPVGFSNSIGNALPTNIAPQFFAPNYNPNLGIPSKSRHRIKSSSRKISKITKTPQSVSCSACNIICDTEEVLKKHRLGKKHKQNLEKLKAVVSGQSISPAIVSATSASEAQDTSTTLNGKKKKKKKASETDEDMETKKKRVLEAGAAMDGVKTCSICKVVCNSETVFQYHLFGKKHAAMVKSEASGETHMAPAS